MSARTIILGAGVTGLAAGIASGLPVYEAERQSGGICSSYYLRPGSLERLHSPPADGEVYRFEIGGGHWIFGGDPAVLQFLSDLVPMRSYLRRSSVYFRESDTYVSFPLQNNLRALSHQLIAKALPELAEPNGTGRTTKEWLAHQFGKTLCDLFFFPFHQLYTAGLYDRIAPQDDYKSPVNLGQVIRGAFTETAPAGYNVKYLYPTEGLDSLTRYMAKRADVHFEHRVQAIDVVKKEVSFCNGEGAKYERLIVTLPLNRVLELTQLKVDEVPDPFTSVLVLNIGAVRGPKCPSDHWLYNPDAKAGFHRIGFYSNVDTSFLPRSAQPDGSRVSIYVERAYVGGSSPTNRDVEVYQDAVQRELQAWGFINDVEVNDSTWIDVAYTWSWPNSGWRVQAMRRLEEMGIYPVGRYGRWVFQGIAESVRDGFMVGSSLRGCV